MAIADTITSMQTHTSNAYTMIGYGTDLTGINKNLANLYGTIFEAFLEALRTPDTLFTNLPKKTGSGSNIALNDTAYAPMKIILNTTATTQTSTPTPSSPQEVKTVTGLQKIICSNNDEEQVNEINLGKNLFDKDDNTMILNSVYVNTSTGKIQSASNSTCVYIKCKSNTTYTISKTAGTRFVVGSTNETPTLNLILNKYTSNANASSITFKTGANDTYLVAWIWSGGTDTTITSSQMLASVQIEKGSQVTSYSEYFTPIELCKIGTYEDKIFKTTGKNLLDISKIEIGKSWSGATNTQRATILWLPIKANQQYNFVSSWTNSSITNIRVILNHGSSDQINNLVVSSFPFTNTTWEYASVEVIANTTFTETMLQNVYVMLCEGTNADYEPYSNNEWYVKKAIGKEVLDGSETWVDSGYNASAHHYTYQGANKMGGQTNLISNKFVTSTVGTLVYSCVGNASNTNITLKMPLDISTVAQMKTWLGSNITTVYFVLASPTYEKLNDTLQEELENACYGMLSYKGQTNIIDDTENLPFTLDVTAIEDLS